MIVKKTKLKIERLGSQEASIFVEAANKYACDIMLVNGTKKANGKSIMGMLSLTLKGGDQFIISFDGVGEKDAAKELLALL